MAFKKSFVVSEESVNSYGFVVITSGIRLEQAKKNCPAFYNHRTWEIPFGHWENFRIENSKLVADLVIEGDNEIEKEYIRKIENGDLKGASIGADPLKWNSDLKQLKKGQTAPTLEECLLYEISLTPLPGNSNALSLKHGDSLIMLSEATKNIIPALKQESDMKAIALKLGLSETATESEILEAIGAVQLQKSTAQSFVESILNAQEEKLTDEQKPVFLSLKKTDPVQAMKFVELQAKPEAEQPVNVSNTGTVKDKKVTELIQKKGSETTGEGKDSFDYLQKHNPVELARIRTEEPEKYQQLASDYSKGVRYKG